MCACVRKDTNSVCVCVDFHWTDKLNLMTLQAENCSIDHERYHYHAYFPSKRLRMGTKNSAERCIKLSSYRIACLNGYSFICVRMWARERRAFVVPRSLLSEIVDYFVHLLPAKLYLMVTQQHIRIDSHCWATRKDAVYCVTANGVYKFYCDKDNSEQ